MKKILVVGCKGFIGSCVHSYYTAQKDFETWGADVVTDYTAQRYFLIDTVASDFDAVFESEAFEICINCAGAASVPDSFLNPSRDFYLNANHVFNLLDAIRNHSPLCRFLNLSSAAVYGNPERLPVSEEHPVKPLSPYGWSKYQAELICKEFNEVYGLRTCSARIFSAFGDGLQKQLFWDWYCMIRQGSELSLYGTGGESRDFIFIDDLVSALACMVDKAGFNGEWINVGNGEEIFIRDAIEVFREASDVKFAYHFSNKVRAGDPLNWCGDISKLKALGYKPNVSFEEGVKRYLKWARGRG